MSIFSMLYQEIISYPSHLIYNLLHIYKDKVGEGEIFFSKVSSDWKVSISLSVEQDCKASIPLYVDQDCSTNNGMDAL